jgi:hypothetical protein
MFSLILALVILGLVFYLVMLIPLQHPFPVIIQVVFVLIAIVMILNVFAPHMVPFRVMWW